MIGVMPPARPARKRQVSPLRLLWRLMVTMLLQVAAGLASAASAAPTHIAAQLIAESAAEPGEPVTLAVLMRPEPGWHGYWVNPGDAGIGMTVKWTLSPGTKIGALQYPVPDTLLIAGLMNHVFEHDYAVLATLTLPADATPGSTLQIVGKAQWLACTDQVCVPESGDIAATVTVGAGIARDPRFDAWRRALPAPLGAPAHFALAGNRLRIAVPLPASAALDRPHLFVETERTVDYAGVQSFLRKGDLLLIDLPRAGFDPLDPKRIEAVLRMNRAGDGVAISAEPGPVPSGGTALEPAAATGPSLAVLVLSALLGGLLLNVMPCVFPILSLKALSLARAGESERQARAEGLAYTAGVILACLALGVLLLALRAAGEQVGWAFQLQEPGVVAALLMLAVAITANFAGLFEFAVPGFASEGSPQGAFATGLLAAFVATPCTGPFMAAAMGAALLLPVVEALVLFAALGLGLALPFLALAYVPWLRRKLPRPGTWMTRFRRIMAVPMGLTALALVWLLSRLAGMQAALVAVACLVGLLGALFAVGMRQRRGTAALAPAVSALLVSLAAVLAVPAIVTAPAAQSAGLLDARPFSEAALARARAEGKPVFAYFTADWCLTCKVNEAAAIEREETRAAFAKAGVVVLRGDWTRRDPEITRYLSAQGAAGVPLYMWYPAGGGAAQQLPQVLTPATLTDLVR